MKHYSRVFSSIHVVRLGLNICLPQILIAAASEFAFPLLAPSSRGYGYEEATHSKIAVNLVSEIAFKMASATDIVQHYDDTTDTFVDAISKNNNIFEVYLPRAKNTTQKSNIFFYKAQHVIQRLKRYQIKKNNTSSIINYEGPRNLGHFVILSNPLNFSLSHINLINTGDLILYICINQSRNIKSCTIQNDSNKSSLTPAMFLNTTFLKQAYAVMVLVITDDDVRLFEICFYCGINSEKLTLMYESKLEDDFSEIISSLLMHMTKHVEFLYQDFNGHQLKVAFPTKNIYMGCQNEMTTEVGEYMITNCTALIGIDGMMLSEISRRLNFKFTLANAKTHVEFGMWSNIVNDVNQSKTDIGLGALSISASRMKKIQYSIVVGEDPLRIVYMLQRNVFSEGLIIGLVFTFHTWSSLVVTVIMISCVMFFVEKYFFTTKMALFKCFWVVGSILIEQGVNNCERIPGRRFLLPWFLCCIIICTVYKAKLTALLVNPPEEHLSTLDELARAGYDAFLNELDGTLVTTSLELSTDPVLLDLAKRTHVNRSICNVLKDAMTTNIMLIEEQVPISLAVNMLCPKIMTTAELARIRVTKDMMLPSSHAWVFKKKSPYVNAFNYYISLFFQNGLQNKWEQSLYDTSKKNNVNFVSGIVESDENQPAMFGPLIVWGLGMAVAVIFFIGEILFSFRVIRSIIPMIRKRIPIYHSHES